MIQKYAKVTDKKKKKWCTFRWHYGVSQSEVHVECGAGEKEGLIALKLKNFTFEAKLHIATASSQMHCWLVKGNGHRPRWCAHRWPQAMLMCAPFVLCNFWTIMFAVSHSPALPPSSGTAMRWDEPCVPLQSRQAHVHFHSRDADTQRPHGHSGSDIHSVSIFVWL